jgi:hypothetical protein
MVDKDILVDSGATDNFIHPKLLKRIGLGVQALDRPQEDLEHRRNNQPRRTIDKFCRPQSTEREM